VRRSRSITASSILVVYHAGDIQKAALVTAEITVEPIAQIDQSSPWSSIGILKNRMGKG
jgi:hypothetical protein